MADESPARITRVVLKNYKSIVSCDVELRPLTILVGPNGSGKSNFLDALRFVSEALSVGLEEPVRNRGSILDIRSKSVARSAETIGIELHFRLFSGKSGEYGFELSVQNDGRFTPGREWYSISQSDDADKEMDFAIDPEGMWEAWNDNVLPKATMMQRPPDLLGLALVGWMPKYQPSNRLLTSMGFYSPNPAVMRTPRSSEVGDRLLHDCANIASVIRNMHLHHPMLFERVRDYLARITPGIRLIEGHTHGGYDFLEFEQMIDTDRESWRLGPNQVSDGTLRALGVLTALFHSPSGRYHPLSVVGIEEPEAGLHPAAADVLFNALVDASATTQVLVTTHSADLLQSSDLDVDSLLAVEAENGITKIGPVDAVGRSVLKDRLFTAGELLQMKQLHPEPAANGMDGASASPEPASAG